MRAVLPLLVLEVRVRVLPEVVSRFLELAEAEDVGPSTTSVREPEASPTISLVEAAIRREYDDSDNWVEKDAFLARSPGAKRSE